MATDSQNGQPASRLPQILFKKPILIGVILLLLYASAGFFLIPYLFKGQIENLVGEKLGRQISVGKVRFNPFAFKLELADVDINEADGTDLFSFSRFVTNFELTGVFRWAWSFKEISLDHPEIAIKLEPDGSMNLGRLIADLSQDAAATATPSENGVEKKDPPRLFFNLIKITDGHLLFADRSDKTPAEIQMTPIDFEIKKLSTIPDREGTHTVTFSLPDSGVLKWVGKTSLSPFESAGTLTLSQFKEHIAWQFLQDELNLSEPDGVVDLTCQYFISNRSEEFQLVLEKVSATISDLGLTLKDPQPDKILALERIQLEDGRFDLAQNQYTVGLIRLSNGKVVLGTDQDGTFNWLKTVVADSEAEDKSPPKDKSTDPAPFFLNLEKIDFTNISLQYKDDSRQVPMDATTEQVDLSLSLAVSTEQSGTKTIIDNIALSLEDTLLHQAGEKTPLIHLPQATIAAGPLDFADRRIVIGEAAFTGGNVALWFGNEGGFNLAGFKSRQTDDTDDQSVVKDTDDGAGEKKPWYFELSKARLNGFQLSFTDRKMDPEPVYQLANIDFGLHGFKNDPNENFDFDLSLDVKQGGRLAVKGNANSVNPMVTADVDLADLALSPLEAHMQSIAKVHLDSGALSVKGQFGYGVDQTGAVTYNGQAGVAQLKLIAPKTKDTLLSWKRLETGGIRFASLPAGLAIDQVRLAEPAGKLVIRKDKSANFSDAIVKKEAKPENSTQSKPFPIDIKRVEIDNAKLDFADLSLIIPFHVNIHELSGAIAGLSSDPKSRASIDLKGRVQQYGSVAINGKMQPFKMRDYFDVAMSFKNLEMTEMTPYTAEFAGRKVSSGKLYLDLKYLIKNSQLEAKNDLILDYFVLGEPVENKKAISLPLDLAVALMKDADDRIDVGLPITGNLEDPKFKYSHLIWKAIVNLVTKVVAAPFKALGALVGAGGEKMEAVVFEPGSEIVSPPEQEKLARLAGALGKRPRLTLKIRPCYEETADELALKTQILKNDLDEIMGLEKSTSSGSSRVDLSDEAVQQALLKLANDRLTPQEVASINKAFKGDDETSIKKQRDKSQKGAAQSTPDPTQLYSDIFAKMLKNVTVNNEMVMPLSSGRAKAIASELTQTNSLPADRVLVVDSPTTGKVVDRQIECKLELSVTK